MTRILSLSELSKHTNATQSSGYASSFAEPEKCGLKGHCSMTVPSDRRHPTTKVAPAMLLKQVLKCPKKNPPEDSTKGEHARPGEEAEPH